MNNTRPRQKYQFIFDDRIVVTMQLEMPPTIGETFLILAEEYNADEPGLYEITAPLRRCVAMDYHESLICKVPVKRLEWKPYCANHASKVDAMIEWERHQ